jgi:hypothetical protein
VFAGGDEEQPEYETAIPALSALHAAVAERCTTDFTMIASADDSTAITERQERTGRLDFVIDDMDVDTLYSYAPSILASIVDEIADFPDVAFSDTHGESIYTHYEIATRYSKVKPGVPLPVAATAAPGPNLPTSVFVSIAQPVHRKVVTVSAQRVNGIPRMPDAPSSYTEAAYGFGEYGDDPVNCNLLSEEVVHLNPQLLVDATGRMYTTSAEWIYAMDRAPAKHRFGVADYDRSAAASGLTSVFSPEVASIYSAIWKFEA